MNGPDVTRGARERVVEYALACGVVSLTVVTCMRVVAEQLASTFAAIAEGLRNAM